MSGSENSVVQTPQVGPNRRTSRRSSRSSAKLPLTTSAWSPPRQLGRQPLARLGEPLVALRRQVVALLLRFRALLRRERFCRPPPSTTSKILIRPVSSAWSVAWWGGAQSSC